jgi:hypothetical protein
MDRTRKITVKVLNKNILQIPKKHKIGAEKERFAETFNLWGNN